MCTVDLPDFYCIGVGLINLVLGKVSGPIMDNCFWLAHILWDIKQVISTRWLAIPKAIVIFLKFQKLKWIFSPFS